MQGLHSSMVKWLLLGTAAYLRNRVTSAGKIAIWKLVCAPYLAWRDYEIVCRTRQGLRMLVRPSDFVENRLCFFGVWEPAITRIFQRQLRAGDVVIDAGANIGYYSLLASILVGAGGEVFAVEASDSIRRRMTRNLEMNRHENIQVIPFGVWHEEGEATLHLVDGNRGSSTLSDLEQTKDSESVSLRRLDSLIPAELHPRIKLLKIDVEGAEESGLKGADHILSSARDLSVICEITPDRLASLGGSPESLFHLMAGYGFSPYRIANDYSVDAYIKNGRIEEPQPMSGPPDSPCDVLFQRNEKPAASLA